MGASLQLCIHEMPDCICKRNYIDIKVGKVAGCLHMMMSSKWKHFPRYWPFVRSFHVFFDLGLNKLLSKNREAGDLRRYRTHYDVIVMN